MKKLNKVPSLILSLALMLSVCAVCASAEDGVVSGACGENATYTLSGGTLTISGTGEIANYTYSGKSLWSGMDIDTIIVEDGITAVGDFAFYSASAKKAVLADSIDKIGEEAFGGCTSLKEVDMPATMTTLRHGAFVGCTFLESIVIPEGVKTPAMRRLKTVKTSPLSHFPPL